ncbi:C40 family peptidase [Phytohabitans rumicis]|uniref:NlpC/P60 domain-containing protein n=1 Tax=Phytohabitans rumicis TaxID=1076125 RepID=A0A6V8L5F9_9ACTN|nr:C40 family peptidase [Phytohabitans rumicis]GFJ92483.1 hypothetical protein Prum_061250 [Phytohabitans rumicis]
MSRVDDVIAAATAEIGKPYNFGDEGPNSFDCSGLMQWVYARVGIKLPRTAREQQAALPPVKDPLPGDLVFWGRPATHVGLVIGGGKMIAAPHAGARVRVQDIYGTPASYARVQGLGTALAPVTGAVGALGGTVQDWLDGIRAGALELTVAAAGLALVGWGLWRMTGPGRADRGGGP